MSIISAAKDVARSFIGLPKFLNKLHGEEESVDCRKLQDPRSRYECKFKNIIKSRKVRIQAAENRIRNLKLKYVQINPNENPIKKQELMRYNQNIQQQINKEQKLIATINNTYIKHSQNLQTYYNKGQI